MHGGLGIAATCAEVEGGDESGEDGGMTTTGAEAGETGGGGLGLNEPDSEAGCACSAESAGSGAGGALGLGLLLLALGIRRRPEDD